MFCRLPSRSRKINKSVNFRNNNLTSDGQFPSERIFSYTPKTLLGLVNPKNHYKKHLTVPQPKDEIIQQELGGKIPRHSNDALDNLMVGDEVWYRTNNPHSQTRWIKATFSKKYSHNVFQIHVGNVGVMAHRNQLKLCKEGLVWSLPNVLVRKLRNDYQQGNEPEDATKVSEMETHDDPRLPEPTPKGGAHSRKRKAPVPGVEEPRRSKRAKKKKKDKEFYYEF